jgi:mono/diheme cytochrome c family protein
MRMPGLVMNAKDARDLAALLATWRDTLLVPEAPGAEGWASAPGLVGAGRALFDQYQCRGCHRLAGVGGEVGPALDGVGSRRRAAYVLALISDPDRVIRGTAMEDKDLWPEEARAITGYLMTLTTAVSPASGLGSK